MVNFSVIETPSGGQLLGYRTHHQLGFKGVTISDALEAGALQSFGTVQHRAVLATAAGIDLVLCSNRHVSEGEKAMETLKQAYQDGSLARSAFRKSAQRVIDLRSGLAK